MPRAALLSVHARVEGTQPSTWEDPSLVQLWGPRFSAYVVAREDIPVFTLGRLSDDAGRRQRAEDMASLAATFLEGRRLSYGAVGHGLGIDPNALRYGTATGTILMRWEGAGKPIIWTVPRPAMDPREARLELARRYLHVFGVGTASGFEEWAGLRAPAGRLALEALGTALVAVRTPVGDASILASDEASFRVPAGPTPRARLLPSGGTYCLLWGRDRELLVPDPARAAMLWTSRVWPGAVLLDGEIVGTWRRAGADLSIQPWQEVTSAERRMIGDEATALPLPGVQDQIRVRWVD